MARNFLIGKCHLKCYHVKLGNKNKRTNRNFSAIPKSQGNKCHQFDENKISSGIYHVIWFCFNTEPLKNEKPLVTIPKCI